MRTSLFSETKRSVFFLLLAGCLLDVRTDAATRAASSRCQPPTLAYVGLRTQTLQAHGTRAGRLASSGLNAGVLNAGTCIPPGHRRRFVGRVKSMKKRPAPKSSRTRSQWWSCVLSVLVALSLVVQPSLVCAALESSPGHAHPSSVAQAHSHGGDHSHGESHGSGHSHGSADEHHGGDHDGGHDHSNPAHHQGGSDDGRLSLSPTEPPHACCSDGSAPRPVAAPASRSFQVDESLSVALFAPTALPPSADIFALTACHGRDGPPDKPLRSQFLSSSLLGRGPPALA